MAAEEAHMPKLDRNGVNIHFEVQGQGPALLLTHGYSATGEMWAGQLAALTPRFTVITWDMRGHGRSDYPEDQALYSEEATVADMAALLDHVGAQSAVIGGLSLGGYMSLAFHRAHPERTRALLIIDTGPGYKNDQARAAWNDTAIERAERFETEGLGGLGRASAEVRAASHRDATGLARAARGMLTQRDARVIESLPEVRVPAVVIVGENDTPFLVASDYMAAKIPGAKKSVIPAAGHAANIDNPQAFNAALLAFLDEAQLAEPA
jgi:pimeloyl-ACP methyl ester carboxylesterase